MVKGSSLGRLRLARGFSIPYAARPEEQAMTLKPLIEDAAARAGAYLDGLDARAVAPSPEALAALDQLGGALPDEGSSNPFVPFMFMQFPPVCSRSERSDSGCYRGLTGARAPGYPRKCQQQILIRGHPCRARWHERPDLEFVEG